MAAQDMFELVELATQRADRAEAAVRDLTARIADLEADAPVGLPS